jgi:hypothetical protein
MALITTAMVRRRGLRLDKPVVLASAKENRPQPRSTEKRRSVPGPACTEVCDGLDNDCDGAVDEDRLHNRGAGECERNVENCVYGAVCPRKQPFRFAMALITTAMVPSTRPPAPQTPWCYGAQRTADTCRRSWEATCVPEQCSGGLLMTGQRSRWCRRRGIRHNMWCCECESTCNNCVNGEEVEVSQEQLPGGLRWP